MAASSQAQAQMLHRMGNGVPPQSPEAGASLMLRVNSGALGGLGAHTLSGAPPLGSPPAVGNLSPEGGAGALRVPGGAGAPGGALSGGPGGSQGVDAATTAAMLRTMSPPSSGGVAQRALGAMGGLV